MRLPKSRHHSPAFTLLEIVVVLGIVTVLAILAAPHVSGMLSSTRLRTAAEEVQNRLLEAQSLAMLLNTDAELRLYAVPDLIDPTARPTLRKLRIHTLRPPDEEEANPTSADAFEPVGTIINLDQGIEINAETKYTSIAELGFQEASTNDAYCRYLALRFRPDGSVQLPAGKPWFLTLHDKDAHLNGRKLRNFVTVQIEPATGRLRTFQP